VASLAGSIYGALAIRAFEWITEQRIWHGAMVGMVWIDPHLRGKGIGTGLMTATARFLQETEDMDFGTLWTGAQAFYERTGWVLSDCGLFGVATNLPVPQHEDAVSCDPLVSVDVTWLETLRSRLEPCRVRRNSLDYRTVPVPVLRVLCFSVKADPSREGFALVGEEDKTGYFYEMIAPPILWDIIWTAVTGHFEIVFLNGRSGDPFAKWLSDQNYVSWQPQRKAMWFSASCTVPTDLFGTWHIPFFDWI